MILPHGFRRLRLAEFLSNRVKQHQTASPPHRVPLQVTRREVGKSHLSPAQIAPCCSANSNSWRKEATAEQKLTEGSLLDAPAAPGDFVWSCR